MKIFSTHRLHPRATAILEAAGDLSVASALDFDTLTRESAEADITIVRVNLPEAVFSLDRPLRAAIRHGAGLDMIPMAAATAAGVIVANVPGVNARTVAEHVIFSAMALLRQFRRIDHDLRTKGWNAARPLTESANELSGKTIGVIGMGAIGREILRITSGGFGLTVLAATRTPSLVTAPAIAVPLDDLLAKSDIVVIACPLTDETRGLMNAERIARMKPGSYLINVARGPIVEDDALIAALRSGHVAGAALDVFSTQPLPQDHPYFSFDTVIVTPHMAGITEESMERMGVGAAEEAVRVIRGELPVNLRNPEAVEMYRRRFGRSKPPPHQPFGPPLHLPGGEDTPSSA